MRVLLPSGHLGPAGVSSPVLTLLTVVPGQVAAPASVALPVLSAALGWCFLHSLQGCSPAGAGWGRRQTEEVEEEAGAEPVEKGAEEAAAATVVHPCRGSTPPEEAWGSLLLPHLPLPLNTLLHHHHLLPLPIKCPKKQNKQTRSKFC